MRLSMKKYLLIGFVALVLILAFPMTVSASSTTVVNGTVANTMSITLNNATQTFGTFIIGQNFLAGNGVNVTTSSTNWNVGVTATGGALPGYMYAGTKNLQNPVNVSIDNSSWTSDMATWTPVTGVTAGIFYTPIYIKQNVAATDTEGNYSITYTFTGTST